MKKEHYVVHEIEINRYQGAFQVMDTHTWEKIATFPGESNFIKAQAQNLANLLNKKEKPLMIFLARSLQYLAIGAGCFIAGEINASSYPWAAHMPYVAVIVGLITASLAIQAERIFRS